MLGVPKNIGILVTLCHVHKMFLPIVVVKPMRIGVSLNFIIVVVVARCVVFLEEGTKVVLVGDVEGILYDDKKCDVCDVYFGDNVVELMRDGVWFIDVVMVVIR